MIIPYIEKPHNPMVNAGAILVLSLLLNLSEADMSLAEKFDWVMNYFKVSSPNYSHIKNFVFYAKRMLSTAFPWRFFI